MPPTLTQGRGIVGKDELTQAAQQHGSLVISLGGERES